MSTAYQKLLGAESLKEAKSLVVTIADEIALGVIEKALAGEVHAAREVADRTEGKAPHKIEDTEEGPMKIEVRLGEEGGWRGRVRKRITAPETALCQRVRTAHAAR